MSRVPLLAIPLALVALSLPLAGCREDDRGESASHVAHSFVHALKHSNFGRACSYFSKGLLAGSTYEDCRFAYVGIEMQVRSFIGVSPWDGAKFRGSPKVEGEKVIYSLDIPAADTTSTLTLKKNDSGDYRLTDIS
jgi:hypothetical protein